jgi:pimeloyl-ACP methyl ester carboxylesterase
VIRRVALFGILTIVTLLTIAYGVGTTMTAKVETVDWQDLQPASRAQFISAKLGRIHYIDVGEGPPILLMHGSGRSIADWEEGAIDSLARHHRVIAFDYFGNGFSERNPAYTYGYDLWVNEAVELLGALKVPHVTVIGHSVGGALACILAADHPALVDHVVTIGTGMTIEPQQFLPLIPGIGEIMMANEKVFGPTYSENHRVALEAAYRVKGTRAAVLSYMRRQLTIDGLRLVRGTFEDVQVPVLHISGSKDVNIPPEIARALANRTRGRFVSIEGATHMVPIEAPDRLAEEVECFLAETSKPPVPCSPRTRRDPPSPLQSH